MAGEREEGEERERENPMPLAPSTRVSLFPFIASEALHYFPSVSFCFKIMPLLCHFS